MILYNIIDIPIDRIKICRRGWLVGRQVCRQRLGGWSEPAGRPGKKVWSPPKTSVLRLGILLLLLLLLLLSLLNHEPAPAPHGQLNAVNPEMHIETLEHTLNCWTYVSLNFPARPASPRRADLAARRSRTEKVKLFVLRVLLILRSIWIWIVLSYLYIYMYIYLSLSLSIYIYIYIRMYIYIYIYTHTHTYVYV